MNTDVHAHISRRLALLPDDELMHLLDVMKEAGSAPQPTGDAPRGQRLEVISRELQARGLFGPPWWSGAHV